MSQRVYIAIDLKSFYASAECVSRGLNPLTTNLVVADKSRTDKTICLAVSPSLKAYGIGGRARLFEVVQRLRAVNQERQFAAPGLRFVGKSTDDTTLRTHPELEVDFIAAPPRMEYYMQVSTQIYNIYLRHIAPEDIHVYSIDEVFIDATQYLNTYKLTPHQLAMKMIREMLESTGITATAGIGTNMYLAKVAMDIVAKHIDADADGVRIAELDEMSYRQKLWDHRPLTDFWRVGRGIARKLENNEIYTMGMLARRSEQDEESLYRLFGVNAELLIDHAWGYEPCTIEMVKRYRPESNSLSNGQVLQCAYTTDKARIVAHEMADTMAQHLVEKRLVTTQITLSIGYDIDCLRADAIRNRYRGPVVADHYGRLVPKPAHGSSNLPFPTSSAMLIAKHLLEIYDRVVAPDLLVRHLYVGAMGVMSEDDERIAKTLNEPKQLDLFTDADTQKRQDEEREQQLKKERQMQEAVLDLKRRFGKNAVLKGLNFEEGATAKDRNLQIGGHKA